MLAGVPFFDEVFKQLDCSWVVTWACRDTPCLTFPAGSSGISQKAITPSLRKTIPKSKLQQSRAGHAISFLASALP